MALDSIETVENSNPYLAFELNAALKKGQDCLGCHSVAAEKNAVLRPFTGKLCLLFCGILLITTEIDLRG